MEEERSISSEEEKTYVLADGITDEILSTDILLSVNLNYRWILPTDS